MQAYCLKCRTKRKMLDPHRVTIKGGRLAIEGLCPVCSTKMYRIDKGTKTRPRKVKEEANSDLEKQWIADADGAIAEAEGEGGSQIDDLERDLVVAEMRLGQDGRSYPRHLLERADPRLPYYRTTIGYLNLVAAQLGNDDKFRRALAYQTLTESANVGFIVGYEFGMGRWVPGALKGVSLWNRLFNPQEAQIQKMELASTLLIDAGMAQRVVAEEVGVDPPWQADRRVVPKLGAVIYLARFPPSLSIRLLEVAVVETIRQGFVMGNCLARAEWPPMDVTADEVRRADDILADQSSRGEDVWARW